MKDLLFLCIYPFSALILISSYSSCTEGPVPQSKNISSTRAPAYTNLHTNTIRLVPRLFYHNNIELGLKLDKKLKPQIHLDINLVTQTLEELIWCIQTQKPQILRRLVHPKKGVYVDLKAHWNYSHLVKEIASNTGYLYEIILSKKNPQSVYNILKLSKQIEIDYYPLEIEAEKRSYELKLHLTQAPQENYQLNHPVFICLVNRCYVYRFP